MAKGVMSTGFRVGLPATAANNVPWAIIVVPCGIDAMRATVIGSVGLVVAGTLSHIPGSKWMPVGGEVVTSLIVCRYGTPLRNISFCCPVPRFGTEPKLLEKERVSLVRLSSRTLSCGGG